MKWEEDICEEMGCAKKEPDGLDERVLSPVRPFVSRDLSKVHVTVHVNVNSVRNQRPIAERKPKRQRLEANPAKRTKRTERTRWIQN